MTKGLDSRRIIIFLGTLNFCGAIYWSPVYGENKQSLNNNKSYISPLSSIPKNQPYTPSVPLVVIKSQMDKYFALKSSQPQVARNLLELILKEDPRNVLANKEMGYLLLKNNEFRPAMEHFYNVLQINPYDTVIIKQVGAIQVELQKEKIKDEIDKKNGLFFSQSPLVIHAQMDKYFELKKTQPKIARELLTQILKEDPRNLIANKEMGYLLFNNNELQASLTRFYEILQISPHDNEVIRQIGFIQEKMKGTKVSAQSEMDEFYKLKKTDPKKAFILLQDMIKKKPEDPILNTEMGYHFLNEKNPQEALEYFNKSLKFAPNNQVVIAQIKSMESAASAIPAKPLSEDEQLLNQFYELRKTNPQQAQLALAKLVAKYPRNVKGQREMAYSLLKDKKLDLALKHFLIIEQLTPNDYDIKVQIGYILGSLEQPVRAYCYFDKATKSSDPALKLKANQAMTNLGGMQTKILPKPWFGDLYLYPLYYSRFDLGIFPGIGRIGRTFGEKQQLEVYGINRTTWDNRSGQFNTVGLPQIFDDNAIITSFGARYAIFYNSSIKALTGLKLYADVGRAYNLVKMAPRPNRSWRNDFRGGLLYFYGWGAPHEYVDKITWPFKQLGNAYTDISYFTRYNDNIIGYSSIREGLRLFEYQTAEINLYVRGRGGFDKNQDFFNNFVEVGPGIELVPNNRYGFSVRLETLKGYYIKVNSRSKNPYGPNYANNLLIAEYYVLF